MKLSFRDLLKIGGSVFLLYLAINHWQDALKLVLGVLSAGMPLIIGAVIAYMVNILMSSFEQNFEHDSNSKVINTIRRPICMIMAYFTLAAIIVIVVLLILPQLASCVSVIVEGVPSFMQNTLLWVRSLNVVPEDILATLEGIDWYSQLGKIVEFVGSGIGSVMDILITAVSSVFGWVVNALVSLIFSVYILAGKERLKKQFQRVIHRYLPERAQNTVNYVLDVLNECFRRYIVGQCTEAVILGVLCGIGMWILKLPYAVMISTLIAFTALIPIAGAYIGGAIGAFMIMTVDPFKAVVFVIYLVILQQLEGNLIYPRVVGSSMGLPGIWVLAAVTIGGGIMGITGMLLGVPLAAACYRFLKDDVTNAELLAEPMELKEEAEDEDLPIDLI